MNCRLAILPLSLALLPGCGSPPLVNTPPAANTICCLGDSLVAGIGVDDQADSFPAVLGELIGREISALGTSGASTADGVDLCEQIATGACGVVIVTLGGNDIMQQVPYDETEKNLETIFMNLQGRGAVVVFTGVLSPLSLSRGRKYKALCKRMGVLFVPDIMAGIITNPRLRTDEVHPNAEGYRLIAERVATKLKTAGLVD
ncbi:MAG: GDSL-type esterase/lipase family protein [Lentisphaeria bacterium]|nr:GDSL-type esterase/lipase family protein [Lentisphaeria bacterium]MDP7743161.1 GDSL-type esterase/lipase family protein [Lentisphaeria bacterium]